MSAAAERTNPDVDLLVACEAFHAAHRDMKAGRGDTPEAEAAIGWAIDDWYAAIAAVRAIRAHTHRQGSRPRPASPIPRCMTCCRSRRRKDTARNSSPSRSWPNCSAPPRRYQPPPMHRPRRPMHLPHRMTSRRCWWPQRMPTACSTTWSPCFSTCASRSTSSSTWPGPRRKCR
jgi:hypothetical protein